MIHHKVACCAGGIESFVQLSAGKPSDSATSRQVNRTESSNSPRSANQTPPSLMSRSNTFVAQGVALNPEPHRNQSLHFNSFQRIDRKPHACPRLMVESGPGERLSRRHMRPRKIARVSWSQFLRGDRPRPFSQVDVLPRGYRSLNRISDARLFNCDLSLSHRFSLTRGGADGATFAIRTNQRPEPGSLNLPNRERNTGINYLRSQSHLLGHRPSFRL